MGVRHFYSALLLLHLAPQGCHSQACGMASLNPRIVGGADAPPGSWPWQVYLETEDSEGFLYMCGGSLINQHWILTAAHCLYGSAVNHTNAYFGVHNLSAVSQNILHREVVQMEIHPSYDDLHLDNDIALLKMSSPVNYTSYIQPVCLAQNSSAFHTGVHAWVAGWGSLDEQNERFPDVLQEVGVPIVGDNQCKCSHRFSIPDKTICAGFAEGLKDTCQGDSGGPLVVKQGMVWVQAGVVSFGDGCARPNSPGVYAEVSEYQDWIESVVGNEDPPGFVAFASPGVDSDLSYNCTATATSPPFGSNSTATTPPQPTTAIPHNHTTLNTTLASFTMTTITTTTTKTSSFTSTTTAEATSTTTAPPSATTTATANTTPASTTTTTSRAIFVTTKPPVTTTTRTPTEPPLTTTTSAPTTTEGIATTTSSSPATPQPPATANTRSPATTEPPTNTTATTTTTSSPTAVVVGSGTNMSPHFYLLLLSLYAGNCCLISVK